jgi:hypothetical protein
MAKQPQPEAERVLEPGFYYDPTWEHDGEGPWNKERHVPNGYEEGRTVFKYTAGVPGLQMVYESGKEKAFTLSDGGLWWDDIVPCPDLANPFLNEVP